MAQDAQEIARFRESHRFRSRAAQKSLREAGQAAFSMARKCNRSDTCLHARSVDEKGLQRNP